MNKIRANSLVCGLLVLATSCVTEQGDSASMNLFLTNGDAKYWQLVQPYPLRRYSHIVFKSNGRFEQYSVNKSGIATRWRMNYDPVWKIVGDSILDAGFTQFKIEYINKDIMILNNLKVRQVIVYTAAKEVRITASPEQSNDLY